MNLNQAFLTGEESESGRMETSMKVSTSMVSNRDKVSLLALSRAGSIKVNG